MKYTTTSLIRTLEKYPENLPIETELAFIFNYDSDKVLEEVSGKTYDNEEELYEVYEKHATELAIFEGSWEEDNISDLNNILPKYIPGWEVEEHCNNNAILKKDIITIFFQIITHRLDIRVNEDLTVTMRRYPDYKVLFDFIRLLELDEDIDEVLRKIVAQKKYAEDNKLPLFAPREGLCPFCNEQIYNLISLEKAGMELITHCPYCSGAYND